MTDKAKPAIEETSVEAIIGTGYPAPFAADCVRRAKRRLGDAVGLTQYGVNLVLLPPGQASAQRHWHSREDEFVYVLEGELVLVTDDGEQMIYPGLIAGFPAGVENGHHLINRSDSAAVYLEVGTRDPRDEVDYPDIDMLLRIVDGEQTFVHKDGTPWDE